MPFSSVIRNFDQQERALRQQWRTPRKLFDRLHHVFRFSVDACAADDNALLPRYWTKETNCLIQDWSKERVFCNPPFKDIAPFVAKATTADVAVMVFPVTSLATRYVAAHPPAIILIPPNRLAFDPPEGLKVNTRSPALGTVFLVYGKVPIKDCKQLGFLAYRP